MALLLRRLGPLEPQDRGLVHRLSPRRHIGRQRARHGLRNRRPALGGNVHADHGTPFTSWVFGDKIRTAGLLPSFGTVGDGLDNAMMENFWSSMQIELLNHKRWRTRVELANAIFECIEIFHNRQRRHSALGYRTPVEYELHATTNRVPAVS